MYKYIFLILITSLLSANNPKPYAVLGDVIYNNIDKIESLSEMNYYELYRNEIKLFVKEVKQAKEDGFSLEAQKGRVNKKEYLNTLRNLSKKNDYFLRSIKSNYQTSMNENNYLLFSQIINSGLIDTEEKKEEIIDYYYKHQEDINASGVIEDFLNEDAALKALKEAQNKRYKTKKMLQEEKIKRIRENDKSEQEALEKKLLEDVKDKKLKIRENQKKELAH